jgi:hypothetical protein
MHRIVLTALASVAMTAGVSAESQRPTVLPEIIIGGSAPEAVVAPQRCIDVQIGTDHAYGCLNFRLRQQVDRINPSANVPPVDARSPDIRVGIVNMHAVQQQYGRNFGVSVFPQRPTPPVFTTPLTRR